MDEIRVGDRVRAIRRFSDSDVLTYEFDVVSVDDFGEPSAKWVMLSDISAYEDWDEIAIVKRAPVPEPKSVGAVVQFQNPLEWITQTATNIGGGRWVDSNMNVWSWGVISSNHAVVLLEGLGE